jgi:hypothetical protein
MKRKKTFALLPLRERALSRRELSEIADYGRYDAKYFRSDVQIREFIWSKTVVRIPPSKYLV